MGTIPISILLLIAIIIYDQPDSVKNDIPVIRKGLTSHISNVLECESKHFFLFFLKVNRGPC